MEAIKSINRIQKKRNNREKFLNNKHWLFENIFKIKKHLKDESRRINQNSFWNMNQLNRENLNY